MDATPTDSQSPSSTTASKGRPKVLPCPHACRDKYGEPRLFTCSFNVTQHVREAHTQTRPFKCGEKGCEEHKGFNRQYALNRHMRDIHGLDIGPGKGKGKGKRAQVEDTNAQQQPDGDLDDTDNSDVPSNQPAAPVHVGVALGASEDNFKFEAVACLQCGELQFSREDSLAHQHSVHGREYSPFCGCQVCNTFYRGTTDLATDWKIQLEAGGFGVQQSMHAAGTIDPTLLCCDERLEGLATSTNVFKQPASVDNHFADHPSSAASGTTQDGTEEMNATGSFALSHGHDHENESRQFLVDRDYHESNNVVQTRTCDEAESGRPIFDDSGKGWDSELFFDMSEILVEGHRFER